MDFPSLGNRSFILLTLHPYLPEEERERGQGSGRVWERETIDTSFHFCSHDSLNILFISSFRSPKFSYLSPIAFHATVFHSQSQLDSKEIDRKKVRFILINKRENIGFCQSKSKSFSLSLISILFSVSLVSTVERRKSGSWPDYSL